MRSIRTILILGVILLLAACQGNGRQPNVLFILIDDMGWKDLGCYGSDYYETPNMDELAESGLRFTSAYTASPLCSPTRASILTGLEPGRLRFTTPSGHVPQVVLNPQETNTAQPYFKATVPQTRTRLPNEYLTFAEVLKEEGYSTAFMGKWHLGREPYIPENQGFDHVVGGREHPGPPPPGRFFSPWDVETLPPVPEGTHICDVVTDEAIRYMEQQRDNPFLLCLWYYDVHAPYQSKEEIKNYYAEKLNPENVQRSPTMGGMIGNLDENMGRVLKALKDLELEKETIIIFTSDNGGNMYDGPEGMIPTNNWPLRSGKGHNYEGGVRVPMMVRVPGMTKEGTTTDIVTSTVDHFVSLLELLRIPRPDGWKTDGESYVRALKGKDYVRGPIYSTFCHSTVATGNRPNISMRHGPWRFYKFFYDGPGQEHRYELYNLDEDIGETNNLAAEMPERVEEMSRLMEAHIEEAEILVSRKNENYAGNTADAWFGSEDTKLSVDQKILHVNSSGNEPWVETVFTPNISDGNFVLEFEMKSGSQGNGSVSWISRMGSNRLDGDPTPLSITHDGNWHTYRAAISLEGILSNIRITPSESPGDIQVRNIRLETEDGYFIRDWPLY